MDEREARRSSYPLTIPDALLHSEAMQRACADRDFQEIFRLVNRRTGSSHAAMAAAIGKMTSSRVSDIIRGVRGIRGQEVIERVADGFGVPGEMLGLPTRPWEGSPENGSASDRFGTVTQYFDNTVENGAEEDTDAFSARQRWPRPVSWLCPASRRHGKGSTPRCPAPTPAIWPTLTRHSSGIAEGIAVGRRQSPWRRCEETSICCGMFWAVHTRRGHGRIWPVRQPVSPGWWRSSSMTAATSVTHTVGSPPPSRQPASRETVTWSLGRWPGMR